MDEHARLTARLLAVVLELGEAHGVGTNCASGTAAAESGGGGVKQQADEQERLGLTFAAGDR